MVRRGMLRFVAVVAVVCACKDSSPPAPVTQPALTPAASGSSSASAPDARVAADPRLPVVTPLSVTQRADLGLLPEESAVVIGVDLRELQASTAWQVMFAPKVLALRAQLTELQTRCGYDPLASATSATIGATSTDLAAANFSAVVHGFDVARFRTCLDTLAGLAPQGETLEKDSTIAVRTSNGVATAFYFVDDHTTLVVTPRGTRDAVVAMAARRSKLGVVHADIVTKLDSSATLWAIVKTTAEVAMFSITTVFVSAELTDRIALDVNLRMGTMQQATQFATMINEQLRGNPFVEITTIQAIGSDLQVRGAMSWDQVRKAAVQGNGLMELPE